MPIMRKMKLIVLTCISGHRPNCNNVVIEKGKKEKGK